MRTKDSPLFTNVGRVTDPAILSSPREGYPKKQGTRRGLHILQ